MKLNNSTPSTTRQQQDGTETSGESKTPMKKTIMQRITVYLLAKHNHSGIVAKGVNIPLLLRKETNITK